MKLYIRAARVPKKIEVYVVQEYTGYGNGWEDVAEYNDTSSDSLRQAKQDVKDYRDNGYNARIITRKIDNPEYNASQDSLYRNLTKTWKDIENVIGNDDFAVTVKHYNGVSYDDASSDSAIENFVRSVISGDAEYAYDASKDERLYWIEYLDMLRKSIRDKDDIISGQSDYGYIPTTISWVYTRYGLPHVSVLHMVFD